jgi:hypothetical protein
MGCEMRAIRIATIGLVMLGAAAGRLSDGQIPAPMQQPVVPGMPPGMGHAPDGTDMPPGLAEQQARSRNSERQKRLVADTDKLLELATELKTDVNKTNKDILSVDVIKKADEIEKLAHNVKERMKG